MKRYMRQILFCFLTILLFSFSAYAENKKYNVNSADFYVELKENGDAVITERWNVTYLRGDFSRFYKDIYKHTSSLERFSELHIVSVKINDTPCEPTDSSDRPDYHYLYTQTRKNHTFNWYFHAKNESVSYEITYRLSNMVKETDGSTALFCYRFIGADFPETVKNTIVTIVPPNQASAEVRYSKADTVNTKNDKIIFSKQNVSGVLKYHIAMDASYFDGLNVIPLKTIKSEERISKIQSCNPVILFMALLIMIYGGKRFIQTRYERNIYKKILEKNPDYFYDLGNELAEKNIHPLSIAFIVNKTISVFTVFQLLLLDLCRRQTCYLNKESLFISKNNDGLSPTDSKFIRALTGHVKYKETDSGYVVNLSDIQSLWDNAPEKERFINEINGIWAEIQADCRHNSPLLYSLKKKIRPLREYFKHRPSASTYEYFSLIERTHSIDYLSILGMICQRPVKSDTAATNTPLYLFCCNLDLLTDAERISRSQGSGCSSCSSCSGCGGGGAD